MSYIYSIEGISRKERERERERREIILNFKIFCVINVKYKEISWRVRRRSRKEK